MELAFAEKHLREICEREAKALMLYGKLAATQLRRRVADFRAAENLGDVIAGYPKETAEGIQFQLSDEYILLVAGNCVGPKWKDSTRVKLLRIFKS